MNKVYGNLAMKADYQTARRETTRPQAKLYKIPKIKKNKLRRVAPAVNSDMLKELGLKQRRKIERQLTLQHIKGLVSIISLILVITAVYGAIVYRQAMILEANFENIRIEKNIENLNRESNQISEDLAQKTNLDLIRKRAIDSLGLQDPAASQMISVHIPDTDRVVYAAINADPANRDAYLNSVYTNVEGFFKTMNRKGQGD